MTRDPGAQPERTRLSWRRTVLAAAVLLLLVVRLLVADGLTPLSAVLLACAALAWLGFLVGAQRRIVTLAAARPSSMRAPWPALAVAAAVVLIGLSVAGVLT